MIVIASRFGSLRVPSAILPPYRPIAVWVTDPGARPGGTASARNPFRGLRPGPPTRPPNGVWAPTLSPQNVGLEAAYRVAVSAGLDGLPIQCAVAGLPIDCCAGLRKEVLPEISENSFPFSYK